MGMFVADVAEAIGRGYNRSRFQEKGVELQRDSQSWWESKKRYQYSCMLCCMSSRPGAVDCTACPIRAAMLENAEVFWHKMPKQEYAWVEAERRLE